MRATLAELEAVVDSSGVAAAIEAPMPTGGRPRQLSVRSLLVGVLLALDVVARCEEVVELAEGAAQSEIAFMVEGVRGRPPLGQG